MQFITLNDTTLHYRYRTGHGTPIVFLNSLGTDFRIWDSVIDGLDAGVPVLCLDKRGHGLSDLGDITMDHLINDVAALMDHIALPPALICGVSVGGIIAQGLAVARPDLVKALVLCCTGARIGNAEMWNPRIQTVLSDGIASMSDAILDRWFSKGFHENRSTALAGYRNMLTRTDPAGYAGVCAAISDTDFKAPTATITAPTHCIAGADDLSTPPALVQSLADLIDGATVQIIPDCGHLPCIEAPDVVIKAINTLHGGLA